MITTAYINLWNKRVGAIAWDQETRLASFEFEPSFLANAWDVAPMKMPISGTEGKIFSFPELRDTSTFKGIPQVRRRLLPAPYMFFQASA